MRYFKKIEVSFLFFQVKKKTVTSTDLETTFVRSGVVTLDSRTTLLMRRSVWTVLRLSQLYNELVVTKDLVLHRNRYTCTGRPDQ